MYSAELLDHFENPRNAGELQDASATVEVMNPVCGDILRLSVRWEADTVTEVRFRARGCTACIATGSALTELIAGASRERVRALRADDVEEAVGGLIPESKHAAALCIDCVKALLKS